MTTTTAILYTIKEDNYLPSSLPPMNNQKLNLKPVLPEKQQQSMMMLSSTSTVNGIKYIQNELIAKFNISEINTIIDLEYYYEKLLSKINKYDSIYEEGTILNKIDILSWRKSWTIRKKESKILTMVSTIPKLQLSYEVIENWLHVIVDMKMKCINQAHLMSNIIAARIKKYQNIIEKYDDLFNDCLQSGYELKSELNILRVAIEFYNEVNQCRCGKPCNVRSKSPPLASSFSIQNAIKKNPSITITDEEISSTKNNSPTSPFTIRTEPATWQPIYNKPNKPQKRISRSINSKTEEEFMLLQAFDLRDDPNTLYDSICNKLQITSQHMSTLSASTVDPNVNSQPSPPRGSHNNTNGFSPFQKADLVFQSKSSKKNRSNIETTTSNNFYTQCSVASFLHDLHRLLVECNNFLMETACRIGSSPSQSQRENSIVEQLASSWTGSESEIVTITNFDEDAADSFMSRKKSQYASNGDICKYCQIAQDGDRSTCMDFFRRLDEMTEAIASMIQILSSIKTIRDATMAKKKKFKAMYASLQETLQHKHHPDGTKNPSNVPSSSADLGSLNLSDYSHLLGLTQSGVLTGAPLSRISSHDSHKSNSNVFERPRRNTTASGGSASDSDGVLNIHVEEKKPHGWEHYEHILNGNHTVENSPLSSPGKSKKSTLHDADIIVKQLQVILEDEDTMEHHFHQIKNIIHTVEALSAKR